MTLAMTSYNRPFKFKIKTEIIHTAAALFSATAIIMGTLGIFTGETTVVLPGRNGVNPISEVLRESLPEKETVHIINPDTEVRGVWIATVNNINFPSKKGLDAASLKRELDDIIKTALENNLNAIYFQVRPCADALYDSKIFPTSEYLTGKQGGALIGGFDPLEYIVKQAHLNNIKLHAWVNPLRVSYGSKAKPAHDLQKLAAGHPARLNPDYTVAHGDGKLYFNAGIPDVRKLVAEGVREIVENYDVDGIVFDDYFYPYASYTNGKLDKFDDAAEYKLYGGGMSLDDWRRDNINKLIKDCYDTVKNADPECLFGVSPFGIWRNNNGKNGGSDTNGTSAYDELYCDAAAWINGGYVDYIAPQLYWDFNTNVARYDTLVRWWNALCDSTGVDLLIAHGAYRYTDAWKDADNEILNQIEFARSELTYRGSIMYGYEAIAKNHNGISDELKTAYANEIIYSSPVSTESGVTLSSPQDGITLSSLSQTYLLGTSDPAYPLYYNGKKVGRTKSGYFSLMTELNKGKNELIFNQNGKDYTFILYNGTSQGLASTSGVKTYKLMESFDVIPAGVQGDSFLNSGDKLTVKVKAPAGSSISAKLGDITVNLKSANTAPDASKPYEETYSAVITMPNVQGITDLGKLTVTATYKRESKSIEIGNVRVGKKGDSIPVEVTADITGLKIAPDSYYYDDFTSQAKGMRDNAVRLEGGYYQLRVGGYVSSDDVRELDDEVPIAKVTGAEVKSDGKYTTVYINADTNIPMNGRVEDGYFILNLYNVDASDMPLPILGKNPMFESVTVQKSTKTNCFRYHFKLKNKDNFYGFEFEYKNGQALVKLRDPIALPDTVTPLEDRVIVLDAGHGGRDMGASGSSPENTESKINLAIVLSAKEKLEKLGAQIILTRADDTYVALSDRMNSVEAISPDICVSVHQNSMEYNVDITKIRGTVAMYWEYAGRSLAQTMASSFADALGRLNRGASQQKLAMVRCERYPSVLIEVGFMTNVEEYEKTTSPEGIEKCSQAIVDGILNYYHMQKNMLD